MKKLILKLKVCYLILFKNDTFYINHIKDNQSITFYNL